MNEKPKVAITVILYNCVSLQGSFPMESHRRGFCCFNPSSHGTALDSNQPDLGL